MAERTLRKYQDEVLVNGSKVLVRAKLTEWSGYKQKEPPGIWLSVSVSNQINHSLYESSKEITKEFSKYAELKHRQIVQRVKMCKNLEQITKVINEVF